MKNGKYTVAKLLELFPGGFSVGPGGDISRTLMATSHFVGIAMQYPVAPPNGGYLVVEMTDVDETPCPRCDSSYVEKLSPTRNQAKYLCHACWLEFGSHDDQ